MFNKLFLITVVLTACIFISSCETVKGTASGLSKDIGNMSSGIKKAFNSIKCADEKFQEKWW